MYWVPIPLSGRLAVMPRPRGGDWLEDEIQGWKREGIATVVSLLEPEEEKDLDLSHESAQCSENGIEWVSFPIPDRGIPESRTDFAVMVSKLCEQLGSGRTVAIHCRQGIGRAGLVAVGIQVTAGVPLAVALEQTSKSRGRPVPETEEQNQWIRQFSDRLSQKDPPGERNRICNSAKGTIPFQRTERTE